MTIIDLIIIYLTAGSPFAVYSLVRNRRPYSSEVGFSAIASGLLWPLSAAKLGRRFLLQRATMREFVDPEGLDSNTTKRLFESARRIEDAFPTRERSQYIRVFREVFDRYCELTLALNFDSTPKPHSNAIFEAAGSPNPRLAAIVTRRRNSRKLSFHQKAARNNILNFVRTFPEHSAACGVLKREMLLVAKSFRDDVLISELRDEDGKELVFQAETGSETVAG